MEFLYGISVGILVLVSYYLGARIGQKVAKNEDLTEVIPHPIREYRERKREERDQEEEREKAHRYDTIMKNIDNYDGSGVGQEDV
jgi:hypothetical protein